GIFVFWGAITPENASKSFGAAMAFFTDNFGWSYLLFVTLFLVFCIVVAFSKFGQIKLGKDDDKPDYSTWTWFAMLFSAGMGIGLVFWSVAEPMYHFAGPPFGEGNTLESARTAMRYVFLHWGLHPWAIYGVVGMALAYFQFRKSMPGLISSTLHPLLGDQGVQGPIGKAVDILAVFATLFGVATSLGLGAMQINSGLNYVYNIAENTNTTVMVIVVMTVLFIISAVTGINRGIKWLSNINMALAGLLMLFVLLLGPARAVLNIFIDTLGSYLQNIVGMSFYTDPYNTNPGWVGGWTIFYWAWWIAWGPFVGTFIARISKGRTVREFIIGVLIAPTFLSFIWLSIMGGTALTLEVSGAADIASAVSANMATALFAMLSNFPLAGLISTLGTILVATFFITSADSATFVMGMLTSGGDLEPKPGLKVFWGITEGAVAAVLLLAGGLGALQTASIVSAFPFMIVMILMCVALVKAFAQETVSTAVANVHQTEASTFPG
ncbi:MAG TPA: BCCT family transporter, partial [Clostridia bacterium]|nr:BCCT family transporter [Clostridia bacterium]